MINYYNEIDYIQWCFAMDQIKGEAAHERKIRQPVN